MIIRRCDGCGREIPPGALRYQVVIEAKAAYDDLRVGLTELIRDHRAEILELIERLRHRDPREIEEQVYKRFELDLCPPCHANYLRDPLRFVPRHDEREDDIHIDTFLRSLGFGETDQEAD